MSTFLTAALAVMSVSPAGAHAYLDRVAPAAGSKVHASPPLLELWFTERVEHAFCNVRVLDRNGKQVDNRDPHVDRANAKLLRVSLPQLAPGTYQVKWCVLPSIPMSARVSLCSLSHSEQMLQTPRES